jgi:hypothetical protein
MQIDNASSLQNSDEQNVAKLAWAAPVVTSVPVQAITENGVGPFIADIGTCAS